MAARCPHPRVTAGERQSELTIGLMDGALQSHPSILVAGTLLFGAGSLLVLVLIALFMLFDSVANLTAIRVQHIPEALVRLYCERVSPLVHLPRRRQALRWTLIVLLIFAPALPRLEMNGWTPRTPRVIWTVLRIVSGVKFIGDEPGPSVSAKKAASATGTTPDSDDSPSRPVHGEVEALDCSFQHVDRTRNPRDIPHRREYPHAYAIPHALACQRWSRNAWMAALTEAARDAGTSGVGNSRQIASVRFSDSQASRQ